MYTYRLSSEKISVDYYTDERYIYPEEDSHFSNASIWQAKLSLITSLIYKQRRTTIVDYPEVSIHLSVNDSKEEVFLGSWLLKAGYKKEYDYQWDCENEAKFLEKYELYREGDKDLLAIEQSYHEMPKLDENKEVSVKLQERLADFTEKYTDSIKDYAPTVGILYFFLKNYEKAFHFFTLCPSPTLQDLTYRIAERFEYSEPEYMKKHDALYNSYRPPFLS